MSNKISQHYITTEHGHTISVFFNHQTDLLVIDVVHQNERGGNEILRKRLDYAALLGHLEKPQKITVRARARRTNTFAHLEGLCWSKGIVCERVGKRIELTLGGTTGTYDSVREALDGYRHEEPFCSAPLKLGRFVN